MTIGCKSLKATLAAFSFAVCYIIFVVHGTGEITGNYLKTYLKKKPLCQRDGKGEVECPDFESYSTSGHIPNDIPETVDLCAYNISVGWSPHNIFKLPSNGAIQCESKPYNKQLPYWKDRFMVTTVLNEVIIQRIDTTRGGWKQHLVLGCLRPCGWLSESERVEMYSGAYPSLMNVTGCPVVDINTIRCRNNSILTLHYFNARIDTNYTKINVNFDAGGGHPPRCNILKHTYQRHDEVRNSIKCQLYYPTQQLIGKWRVQLKEDKLTLKGAKLYVLVDNNIPSIIHNVEGCPNNTCWDGTVLRLTISRWDYSENNVITISSTHNSTQVASCSPIFGITPQTLDCILSVHEPVDQNRDYFIYVQTNVGISNLYGIKLQRTEDIQLQTVVGCQYTCIGMCSSFIPYCYTKRAITIVGSNLDKQDPIILFNTSGTSCKIIEIHRNYIKCFLIIPSSSTLNITFRNNQTSSFLTLEVAKPEYFDPLKETKSKRPQANPNSDALLKMYENVSIVYTWVNGSEPHDRTSRWVWGGKIKVGNSQSRDNDELKYSFRSLEKFLPWHKGKIYLVTPTGQVPYWLNTSHPRIVLIDQNTLIPDKDKVPIFSSNNIEPYLYTIPNIGDVFIHMNDDYFFANPVLPGHLFVENGVQLFLGPSELKVNRSSGDWSPLRKVWQSSTLKTWDLVHEMFGLTPTYYLKHAPFVYHRNAFPHIHRLFGLQISNTLNHKFRHPDDIITPILHHSFVASQGHKFGLHYGVPIVSDLRSMVFLGVKDDPNLVQLEMEKIVWKPPKFFVLNDLFSDIKISIYIKEFLKWMYPKSSTFEIGNKIPLSTNLKLSTEDPFQRLQRFCWDVFGTNSSKLIQKWKKSRTKALT